MDAKETVELEHGEVRTHVPSRPGIGCRRPSVLIGRRLAECKFAIIVYDGGRYPRIRQDEDHVDNGRDSVLPMPCCPGP